MHARHYLSLTWLLSGLVLAACAGGSGSSGFDNGPSAENAAIQKALDQQHCVRSQAVLICPADQVAPTAEPTATASAGATNTPESGTTPTPTATPQPRVDTGGIDQSGGVDCAPSAADRTCQFTLPFAPQGFPPTALYRVAVRTDKSGHWTISSAGAPNGPITTPSFDAPVAVQPPVGTPGASVPVQIAILVFLDPHAVVPAEVTELAQSGAEYAFVTAEISVRPEVPGPS